MKETSDDKRFIFPGLKNLSSDFATFPKSILLVSGPAGSGKTAYSIQFLQDGMLEGHDCMYLSCTPSLKENVFQYYFKASNAPKFLGLFADEKNNSSSRYRIRSLEELLEFVSAWIGVVEPSPAADTSKRDKRFVLDSLTDLIVRFSLNDIQKFIVRLYDLLKANDAIALFTITGTSSFSESLVELSASILDGVIQLKLEESPTNGNQVKRAIRLFSHKGARPSLRWTVFIIHDNKRLEFVVSENTFVPKSDLLCKLCEGPILSSLISTNHEDSEQSQYHPHCLDTYRKLGELYGSHILYALEPGVVNANFFFIDIVGLSNPLLSVENQINKIRDLNKLIHSCDVYSKVSKDKRIVLPTGDGMVIGFLLNPELPLLLSVQLHSKIREFNAQQKTPETRLGVRIGLSSGPVFVVSDVNENQNVWGPGIILARRVMDLGDDGHILLADNIAEALANLKDDYKKIIKLISSQKIKHGQSLRLYSAYSAEFGNPSIPSKLASS